MKSTQQQTHEDFGFWIMTVAMWAFAIAFVISLALVLAGAWYGSYGFAFLIVSPIGVLIFWRMRRDFGRARELE